MQKFKGYVYILFFFLSWKITQPISTLFLEPFFEFEIGLHLALTLMTTAVMTKVFIIVFPPKTGEKDRFLFIPLNFCVILSMGIGIFLAVIWFFIH